MTKVRNQTIIKQITTRDFGLCRCCGFKGSEVHHIVPLCFGGEDNTKNAILLCSYCHKNAPDNKQDFYEYMQRGGAKTERLLGNFITILEERQMEFHKFFPFAKEIMKSMKNIEKMYAVEKYNLKDSLEIEDVDFANEIKEYKDKFKKLEVAQCK